jgi:hypothetical protein
MKWEGPTPATNKKKKKHPGQTTHQESKLYRNRKNDPNSMQKKNPADRLAQWKKKKKRKEQLQSNKHRYTGEGGGAKEQTRTPKDILTHSPPGGKFTRY